MRKPRARESVCVPGPSVYLRSAFCQTLKLGLRDVNALNSLAWQQARHKDAAVHNDHDPLRRDPFLAVACANRQPPGTDRRHPHDHGVATSLS